MFRIGLVTIAVTSMVFAPGASAQNRAGHDASLRSQLAGLVRAGAPGALLLTRSGSDVTLLASGLADTGNKTPLRANDRFRAGSLEKTYVATVALQLVAAGKLSLDASVESLVPGVVPNGGNITVRELLDHTSGLFDFNDDQRVLKPYLGGNLAYRWQPRKLVQIAVSHKALFAPGARYSYSNTNYLVVGLIIEAVTGNSLEAELRTRIIDRLHLTHTTFPTTPQIQSPYAHGYYIFDKPPAADISGVSPYPWAAGAIVSTAPDIATFYRALLQGKLLGPEQLRQMKATVPEGSATDFAGSRYGLGLERYTTPCGVAWGHGGNFPGYITYALTSSDGQRQAVLMLNQDPLSLSKHVAALFKALLLTASCSSRR